MGYSEGDLARIREYINTQLRAGYDIRTLRNFLIKQGYPSGLVDEAIDKIYSPKVSKRINIDPKVLMIGAGVVVVIVVAIFLFPLLFSEEGNRESDSSQRDRGLVGTRLDDSDRPSPIAVESVDETKQDKIIKEVDDEVEIDQDARDLEVNSPVSTRERSVDSLTILEIQNKIDDAGENEGSSLCSSLEDEQNINACYKKMAIKYNKKEYCGNIVSQNLKDDCYIVFAFSGDLEACNEIKNQYHLLTCRSLGRQNSYEGI